MERIACHCSNGACHTCQYRAMQMVRCRGCGHWFCPTCVQGLGEIQACDRCARVWLELTTQLILPAMVEAWINEVTRPKGTSEVW
jgi:hypothetical protein